MIETKKFTIIERFFGSIGYFLSRIKGSVAQQFIPKNQQLMTFKNFRKPYPATILVIT
jgi:hypothetical protein